MEKNLYIAIIDREYRGESTIYVTSPICKDKDFARKLLFKEFEKLKAEILPPDYPIGECVKSDDSFFITDERDINDVWGWVQEVKVDADDDFDDLKSAYTILSKKEVDNIDDDFLNVDIVLAEQPYKKKVSEKIDELIENFKKEFPANEYDQSNEEEFCRKSVSFQNDDDDEGELIVWYEIHDIV